jgi:stress response protein YsnF
MAEYNIVAIFRSRAEAERARERLIRDNVPTGDIRVRTGEERDVTAPAHSGVFDWLFARNLPDEDQTWYRSHLHGERAALSVRVGSEMLRDRVAAILEEFDPIEENELAAEGAAAPVMEPGVRAPTAPTLEPHLTERREIVAERGAAAPPAMEPGVAVTEPLRGREEIVDRPRDFAATEAVAEGEQVIPVVREELTVGKRPVERRRRIRTYVIERPVEEQVTLRDERIVVERRPASGELGPDALQQREFEVIERHEEPVVERRTRGVEEVVVRKEAQEHTETVRDTVRETKVEVEGEAAETVEPGRPAAVPPINNPKV